MKIIRKSPIRATELAMSKLADKYHGWAESRGDAISVLAEGILSGRLKAVFRYEKEVSDCYSRVLRHSSLPPATETVTECAKENEKSRYVLNVVVDESNEVDSKFESMFENIYVKKEDFGVWLDEKEVSRPGFWFEVLSESNFVNCDAVLVPESQASEAECSKPIPGKLPRIAIRHLVVEAAWAIENREGRRACDREVFELLREWAVSGLKPEVLSGVSSDGKNIKWLTSKAKAKYYDIEACGKALKDWNLSRSVGEGH